MQEVPIHCTKFSVLMALASSLPSPTRQTLWEGRPGRWFEPLFSLVSCPLSSSSVMCENTQHLALQNADRHSSRSVNPDLKSNVPSWLRAPHSDINLAFRLQTPCMSHRLLHRVGIFGFFMRMQGQAAVWEDVPKCYTGACWSFTWQTLSFPSPLLPFLGFLPCLLGKKHRKWQIPTRGLFQFATGFGSEPSRPEVRMSHPWGSLSLCIKPYVTPYRFLGQPLRHDPDCVHAPADLESEGEASSRLQLSPNSAPKCQTWSKLSILKE